MNILLVLIPLSLLLVAIALWAFFWAVNHAQFDDLDTPALTPLSDESGASVLCPSQTASSNNMRSPSLDP